MEENSSNQMETDVSSTKADVPDTQEVTGSDGQVEMVIVVEKVQEGQMDSPACKLTVEVDQSNSDDKESSVSSDPVEKSPQKSSDKSPDKSSVTETTHQKSQPLDKSPSKSTDKGVMKISKDSELPVIVIRSPITDKISTKSPVKIIPLTQLQKTPPKSPCTSQPVKTPQKPSPPKVLTVEQEKNMPPDSPEKKLVPSVQIQVEDIDSSSSTIETKSDKKDEGKECTDNKTQDVDMEEPTNMDKPQLETKKTPYKPESDSSKPEVVTKTNVISIDMEKEASNDSQLETCSDTSEREHKSISRELKSLIKSAKESKIISECTQLTSKTRKSRTLDSSNISLNMSVEAEKIQGARRGSNNSVKSNCSEKSEKVAVKRSMRSQNPEFVTKVKQFLNSVTGKKQEENESEEAEVNKSKDIQNTSDTCSSPKKKKVPVEPISSDKPRSDTYCWRCHWTIEQGANEKTYHQPMMCTVCPRSFHFKCLPGTERNKINLAKSWVCPECLLVLHAENSETRSPAMKKITLGMLCDLLKYALERMMELNGVEPFTHPVDQAAFPDYEKYVVHPMHLNQIQENITAGHYGSTEAFIGDVQWILHNSIIFNTMQSKLTGAARALVRLCRAEMGEIEACPECYAGAHARRPTWFTDVCSTPHILLWAKLKGFPYWPAKGMTVNESGLVDVRFFGAHDRAWVPARDCFLYSEKDPNNFRTKRQDIIDSMQEAEQHIRNISRKYGKFVYPPFKTVFDPTKLSEQLKMMIPSFEGEVVEPAKQKPATVASSPNLKNKSRSNSKSSKSDFNEGDISEGEDASAVQSRKMADGAEIAMEEDESVSEKNKTIEIEVPPLQKDSNSSRKRRRSDLEEATLTVLNTSSKEKKKRVETEEVAEKKKSTEVKKPSTPKSSAKKVEASDKKDVPKDTEVPDETAEPKEKPEKEVAEDATSNKNNDKSTKSETKSVEKPTKTYNNSSLILSSSTDGSKPKLTFKITLDKSNKRVMRTTSTTLVKDATKDKSPARNEQKKPSKVVKPLDKINRTGTPEDKAKRRRSSKSNKSSNSSQTKTDKKTTEGKKDASKNESANKSSTDNSVSTSNTPSATSTPKSSKDRLQFDDDTSLAVIAREVAKKSIVSNSVPGLPTISSVRSLSTSVQSTVASTSTVTRSQKTVEPAVTNSSKETSKNKEADKKKGEQSSIVGTVGVRAFARMTSPDKILEPEVEIKTEPIELDEDPERHNEKMDLMNAFRLQPVNQQPSLREMRINKVFVGPVGSKTEVRPRAKKTFPQPKKSASELNCKNSMVYIPIQPPLAQAPPHIRPRPPTSVNGAVVTVSKPVITCANNLVNTMATPLMPNSSAITIANTTSTVVSNAMVGPVSTVGPLSTVGPMANMATMSTLGAVPTIGPSNVHTVPLITSVNGQWTFSLQPMMSLGGINSPPSPPVNGVRPGVGLASITPTTVAATPAVSTPPEPPRLQQRPLLNPLDASTPLGAMPPPSTAGPLTAKLNQSAVKLADFFRTLMEDCMEKVDDPTAQLAALKLKMEQTAWKHQQEIDEVKHNNGLVLAEMRASLEKEKVRIINEMRRNAQAELEAAVKVAKSKQWCANCSQEAQFYCCWNTSYCDYQCQRSHWPQHHAVCTQQNAQGKSGESGSNSDKRPPETLPKTTQAPVPAPPLTVGGKPATKGSQNAVKQPSIIMSMVEDSNGAQSMRCVGTYKVPDSSPNSSVLINKQAMNSEDNAAAKKVVTSGGYLIVGGNSNNAPMVAPARRTHAVQYFS